MKTIKVILSIVCMLLIGNVMGAVLNISPAIPDVVLLLASSFALPSGVLMSIVPGIFSETTLQTVRVKMAAMLLDGRVKLQYTPQADGLLGLSQVSTAKFRELEVSEKDYEVELEWINACGPEVEDFTACTFGGDKASTNTQKYKLNFDQEVNFTIYESDFTTNDFNYEEALAALFLRADKQLMEAFAQFFYVVLNAGKGVNQYAGGYTICGSDTYIPAVNWTNNLMAYFMMMSKINQFSSPVLLDGGNLYQAYQIAGFNAGNADGKGAQAMFQNMKIFFDLINPLLVNGDINTDYIIETGAMSWANKVYFPNTAPKFGDDLYTRWNMGTKFSNLLPLKYDVISSASCDENNLTKRDFKVRLKAGVFVNPTGCSEDNTGILTMLCGNAPC